VVEKPGGGEQGLDLQQKEKIFQASADEEIAKKRKLLDPRSLSTS
jgi:hypothetical protein